MNDPLNPAGATEKLRDLRSRLDAVDHELLEILDRRLGLVTEIARTKRTAALPVRDLTRERDVLTDRARRAEELGLPGPVVESIFRLLLLASRDHQARLRAGVSPKIEPRTIAVIGGKGGLGSCMARLFGELGHSILIVDLDTELRAEQAAGRADVTIISVPIRETDGVIRQVGRHIREDALLMDVTSVKTAPLARMLSESAGSVIGTHPMFGPGVHTFQGQRMVLCPGRGDHWLDWVRRMLTAQGLVLEESTAESHDRAMAIVQVLHHFKTQTLGLALSRLGTPVEEALAYTSPAYLLESYVTARHFAQSPELYGPIEMSNPRTAEVTGAFEQAVAELREILASDDQPRFNGVFEEVRRYFGSFTDVALEQSAFLIDRLVELTAGVEE